jgi:hypothetical protein
MRVSMRHPRASGMVMLESHSFRFTIDIAGMHNVTKMRLEPIRVPQRPTP